MKIGFVTIGQSPRDDLISVFRKRIGERHDLIILGTLDGISPNDVAALAPNSEEEPLVTQLRSGQSVTIAKERILGLMQAQINELQALGVEFIVALCTGPFPELRANVPLLLPDVVLRHFVQGVMPAGKLGVIAPLAGQHLMMREKWHDYDDLTVAALDPYDEHGEPHDLPSFDDCGIVVLDCMGYSPGTRRLVHDHAGKPVILAQDVLAHAVELLVSA